jgi:hypothetical protein
MQQAPPQAPAYQQPPPMMPPPYPQYPQPQPQVPQTPDLPPEDTNLEEALQDVSDTDSDAAEAPEDFSEPDEYQDDETAEELPEPGDFEELFDDGEDAEEFDIPEDQILPANEPVELEDDFFSEDEDEEDDEGLEELVPDMEGELADPEELDLSGDASDLLPYEDPELPGVDDISHIPDLSDGDGSNVEEPIPEELDDDVYHPSTMDDVMELEDIPEDEDIPEEDTVIDYGLGDEDLPVMADEPEEDTVEEAMESAPSLEKAEPASMPPSAPEPASAPRPRPPQVIGSVSNEAQAKMFDYLLGLVGTLPADTRKKAEDARLNDRVSRLQKRLLGDEPHAQEGGPQQSRGGAGKSESAGKSAPGPAAVNSGDGNPMEKLMDTLRFAKDLSDVIPEEDAERLRDKMRRFKARLDRIHERLGK